MVRFFLYLRFYPICQVSANACFSNVGAFDEVSRCVQACDIVLLVRNSFVPFDSFATIINWLILSLLCLFVFQIFISKHLHPCFSIDLPILTNLTNTQDNAKYEHKYQSLHSHHYTIHQ